jgi:hypothetical protein
MKKIKYKFVSASSTKDNLILLDAEIHCKNQTQLDANLPIAEAEAYNREYTIEDDGVEELPTDAERIAELEEALALLLSGVTE